MAPTHDTSAERRFRPLRHELVLQLSRRSGPFWEAVEELRQAWAISPAQEVPTDRQGVYLPRQCESIAEIDPYDFSPEGSEVALAYEGWMNDLYDLHETFVPEHSRIGGGYRGYWSTDLSFEGWARFLSLCVLHDPPPDRLVDFADASPHGPEDWLDLEGPLDPTLRALLVAPEIRYLRDGDLIQRVEGRYHHEVLGALADRLAGHLEPAGIDFWDVVREVEADAGLRQEHDAWLGESEARPYIAVFPHTTRDAVEAARRQILSDLESAPQPGAPRRDALAAEEIANLRRSGLTEGEIAERKGWSLSADDYGARRRSSTVRRYLAAGPTSPQDQESDE